MLSARISLVAVLVFPSLTCPDEKPRTPAGLAPQVFLPKAAKKDGAIQVIVPVQVTYHVLYSEEVLTPDGKRALVTKYRTLIETHFKAVRSKTALVAGSKEFQALHKEIFHEVSKAVVPKNRPKLFGEKMAVFDFAAALGLAQAEINPNYPEVIKVEVQIVIPRGKELPGRKTSDK